MHADMAEKIEHTSETFVAMRLPYLTGMVSIPARASPTQSIMSMSTSRLSVLIGAPKSSVHCGMYDVPGRR
jgi:hypothetical protein